MDVPNYTYLKLKMPNPKGVIIVKGSFEQAYYYEQDCVTQAVALITPYPPDGPDRDIERALAKEAVKAAAVPSRPGISEAAKIPGGSDGSASPLLMVVNIHHKPSIYLA
jgi:hypothetical protein